MAKRCIAPVCTQFRVAIMANKRLTIIFSILLALLFIFSALAKLWSADQFEIYVYSYGFFQLDVAYVLARLCIAAELVVGLLLLTGWRRKWVLTAALAMLLFFTLFLCYAALIGRTDSCQCFGQLADLSPTASLLKNALLIVLTLLCMKWNAGVEERRRKVYRWLVPLLIAIAVVSPFIISVPDSWMFGESHERYNEEQLQELDLPHESTYVVAFVTSGCPYCRMTRQKLDTMFGRHKLPKDAIIYFEPKDIGVDQFINITYGARPLVLLMQDGEVIATYHYRNINERQIVKAFNH